MSQPNEYDEGQVVRIKARFYNESGNLANPTTVRFRAKDPAGTIAVDTTSSWVQEGLGTFYYDLDLASNGRWHYRWESTGAVKAAKEGTLVVRRSRFI